MSISQTTRDALWEAMVERAELLHDMIVANQRRATRPAAQRIESQALDLAALARAAALPGRRS